MKERTEGPILFADDDENDTYFFRLAVDQAGVSNPLLTFVDGQGVIDYLEKSGHPVPSLLVLDLKMSRVGGFDVLIWLREEPKYKHVPAVVLSASQQDEDSHRALELGAVAYLVKPVDLRDLVSIVREMQERWLTRLVGIQTDRHAQTFFEAQQYGRQTPY
jgi:CheY-like chemotaxis protein